MYRPRHLALFAAAAMLLSSVATSAETIEASSSTNPPPSVALGTFDRIEVAPIAMPENYARQKANKKALTSLQKNLDERLARVLPEWNGRDPKNDPPRVLRVEPRVEKIKFIGGGARFFAGALAGKSAVLMRVRMTDAATGEEIADPEFYQHASAMSGAWSVGGADNAMLARETTLIVDYLTANQINAVGGQTSSVDEQAKEK
jgi:hypothetical protein